MLNLLKVGFHVDVDVELAVRVEAHVELRAANKFHVDVAVVGCVEISCYN